MADQVTRYEQNYLGAIRKIPPGNSLISSEILWLNVPNDILPTMHGPLFVLSETPF